jgi:hypothetical protein
MNKPICIKCDLPAKTLLESAADVVTELKTVIDGKEHRYYLHIGCWEKIINEWFIEFKKRKESLDL